MCHVAGACHGPWHSLHDLPQARVRHHPRVQLLSSTCSRCYTQSRQVLQWNRLCLLIDRGRSQKWPRARRNTKGRFGVLVHTPGVTAKSVAQLVGELQSAASASAAVTRLRLVATRGSTSVASTSLRPCKLGWKSGGLSLQLLSAEHGLQRRTLLHSGWWQTEHRCS